MLARSILALGVLLLASGCAGTHLYNQSRHELATNTSKTFTEANIAEAITAERQLMQSMATNEQLIVRRHTIAVRNAELKSVMGRDNAQQAWDRLGKLVHDRIEKITSLNENERSELASSGDIEATLKANLEGKAFAYNAVRRPEDPDLPKLCAEAAELLSSVQNPGRRQLLADYVTACRDLEQHRSAVDTLLAKDNAKFGEVTRAIRQIEQKREDGAKTLGEAKRAYEEAKKEYDQALAGGSPFQKLPADQAEAVEKTVEKATKALEKFGAGDNLLGKLAELEEKENAVMGVLQFLASTNATASVPTNAVPPALAALLPTLKEESSKLFKPEVSHLLLVQENLRLQRDEIAREIEREEARGQLLKEKQQALGRELLYLVRATAQLRVNANPAANVGIGAWMRSNPSLPASRAATDALLNYAMAWTVGRVAQEEIDYRLIALAHAQALDGTEFALQRWQNLLGIPIKQLEAYHAAGVKPETVAELIGAAGITSAIGLK